MAADPLNFPSLPSGCPPLHTGILWPQLFDKTFLCLPVADGSEEASLSHLVDQFTGLIKLPFLVWEAQRIQEVLQTKSLGNREFVWFATLSIGSNTLEFICFLGERGYLEIALPALSLMRKIYFVAKIVLYSSAVLVDSELLHGAQANGKEEERRYAHLLLISHMTYLSCMILGGFSLTFGAPCSPYLLRLLHASSLLSDIASKFYELRWGEAKESRLSALKQPLSKRNVTYG